MDYPVTEASLHQMRFQQLHELFLVVKTELDRYTNEFTNKLRARLIDIAQTMFQGRYISESQFVAIRDKYLPEI
jgi:hypothetical protein